jgi:putative DNA-invertase from lambdoid prophage Rac
LAQISRGRIYLGRKPSYSRQQLDRILDLLATESDITFAKQVGLDRLAVRRIRQDPAKAEGALASWEALKVDHGVGMRWKPIRCSMRMPA